jgi:uncharacterized protein
MSIHTRRILLLGLSLVALLLPVAALGGTRGVHDAGGMFGKAEAVADINRQIDEIHARYGVDLYIDTFGGVPAGRVAELNQLGEAKFFPMWAEERALVAGADGLYILVCGSPRHIEVQAGTDAQSLFDKRARDKVRKTLSRNFDRKREQALQDTVAAVRDHLASKEEAAKRGGWLWLVWVMLAILGVWLATALVRRFRGEKPVTPPSVISSSALAGQSIYQSVVNKAPATAPADATTLPYPPPEPKPEGTIHG